MTSQAMAQSPLDGVRALVFFSFPLHLADKPGVERDELAGLELLHPVCEKLGDKATLHLLDTADHGFKVLKRSRASDEDVFVEMARVLKEWLSAKEKHL